MIIETAIPEIEEEANRILGRMTDGRMHVKFETQRDTRSGMGTIETLDIKIADELGTRSYEMFSGGEGFRVNFAIRIALSRLLAHRAGTRLQTLVIDEGFGSQDQDGRERIVEAIQAIQPEFEKILVITHLEDLRDRFPVRIEVTKTARGSTSPYAEHASKFTELTVDARARSGRFWAEVLGWSVSADSTTAVELTMAVPCCTGPEQDGRIACTST